jgi:N-acetyl-gamma-glutamyl-phosphate reductase
VSEESRREGKLSAAVVGGSGFTGALLAELLLRHPSLELTCMSSDNLAGTDVASTLPRVRAEGLAFCRHDEVRGVDAAFVCLPDGAAAPVVRRLLDEGTRVVDLSPDFRLTAADYEAWYGPHPYPEMLPGTYGLTELGREAIRDSALVANPGCYPTAALLALTPLETLGLREVCIDAKSGVSGAGKAANERTHFCSVDEDVVAYGVPGHRHYPEIAGGIGAGGDGPSLVFIPHLVPLLRGITESIYVRVSELPTQQQVRTLYDEAYAGEPFVEVCDAPPHLADVRDTNRCRIFPTVDRRSGLVLVFTVIDNLLKGASGQALQNMNLMLGLPEQEGLT